MARNTEKCEKWQIYTVILDYAEKTERSEKWDTNIVRPGIWRKKKKNWQSKKMRNSHGSTWNMAKNTEKRAKWETNTVHPTILLEKLKKIKNEKYTQ